MKIVLIVKYVYGTKRLYIKDQRVATALQILTGRLTITERDVEALTALGHEVEEVDPYALEAN